MKLRIAEVVGVDRLAGGRLAGNWMRFGDMLAIAGDDASTSRAVRDAGGRETALYHDIGADELFVVTQKGRLFQKEHPDVPVLVDKGRFLLVNASPERAAEIAEHLEPCYALRPWEAGGEVFTTRTPRARSAVPPWITELVAQVTVATVRPLVEHLVGLGTRHSLRPEFTTAAEFARSHLASAGFEVALESIEVAGSPSSNVVAVKPGGQANAGMVYVVAHLDSVNALGGQAASAPGADDNASGSAGALAIAQVLANHQPQHELRVVLFGGEEQGLFGSRQLVAGLPASERGRIRAVLNMDMIGTRNTQEPAVLLEGAALSQSLIDALAEAAAAHTSLAVQTSLNPFASDHVPFLDAGIPAVLTIEGADSANQFIHTAADTLDKIDFDLAVEILKMNIGFVAAQLGQIAANDGTQPQPNGQGGPLSGRYHYAGPVDADSGRQAAVFLGGSVQDRQDARRRQWAADPIYPLDEPLYTVERNEAIAARASLEVKLRIDVDGTDPLSVVSGTVQQGLLDPDEDPLHFIGRVVADSVSGTDRTLQVEDFRLDWPDGIHVIDRADLTITPGAPTTAAVTFTDTARDVDFGPYEATRLSPFFRDVEFDYDREEDAIDVRSYDTHTHPDRPADLPHETITLESTFARSGINVSLSAGSGAIVDTSEAGTNQRWNERELHDSMSDHWDAFDNRPQWKMWLFAAKLADSDTLGGIMFDGDINEPGGVDRQGTALFTECPFFHTEQGGYIAANPPTAEAVQRELFFNLIHESGHAFNLAHSFQKTLGDPWPAPDWMPVSSDSRALSWMNYPDQASPGLNATWFYNRFRFRFDDNENLFLRHAQDRFVQMGNEAWFENHGRVARSSLDPRLELTVRTLTRGIQMGQPLNIEFRLRNVSEQPLTVHDELDLSGGFLEVAITDPRGVRRPFLPIARSRCYPKPVVLEYDERIYHATKLVMGRFGWPFKTPGAYRIEAAYHNLDGTTAADVLQVYVRPPIDYEELSVATELFNARVGRAITFDGTRVMEDVNDKLDWALEKLPEKHPSVPALTSARYMPWTTEQKLLEANSRRVKLREPDYDCVVEKMDTVVDRGEQAADTLGNILYHDVVDHFTESCVAVGKVTDAREAQKQMLGIFRKRDVIEPVLKDVERRVEQLGGSGGGRTKRASTKKKTKTARPKRRSKAKQKTTSKKTKKKSS